jgi:SAM-dependent methyltransferase
MTSDKPTVAFSRRPLNVVAGVPVFAVSDSYIQNYDAIARDHLAAMDKDGINPFIGEQDWTVLEETTASLMRELLRPGDCLLDAGVGLGRLLSRFPNQERHGADIALGYLERTKQRGIHVALAKLEDLPYPNAAFDMVVATDVLEHVLNFHRVSQELIRVLKPGGHLVIRVPFEEDLETYFHYRDYHLVHVRRFDLWSLRIQFERIFGMNYVQHETVLPKWRGLSMMRITATDAGEAIRNILAQLPDNISSVQEMRDFSYLQPQDLLAFMNGMATSHPELFKQLEALLANDVEINIVFRKPFVQPNPPFGSDQEEEAGRSTFWHRIFRRRKPT